MGSYSVPFCAIGVAYRTSVPDSESRSWQRKLAGHAGRWRLIDRETREEEAKGESLLIPWKRGGAPNESKRKPP